ncbi:MAG: N-acetylglucosamine-6-phosphate deacetylase [Chloroflexi bacterium]|nr:N-acetylglucosamine-6-phosphate deacetylase [Chloroflexota bacterium]
MTRVIITGGKIVTPDKTLLDHSLVIEHGKIVSLVIGNLQVGSTDHIIDAQGLWVTPGYIDVHVHGSAKADTMDATPEVIHAMARFFASCGVTGYYPTTMSGWPEPTQAAIDNVATCPQPVDGAHHLGVHVEGPYLDVTYKGAQPEHFLRDADPAEYEAWLVTGVVKLVTLAPERSGSLDFIDQGVSEGVEFAVAHSAASYEQVIEAADHGLRQGTHTFNGMLGLHHRAPGTVGGILADERIYAQVIADGIHLHPGIVKLIVRAKTPKRTILITDAIRAAGCVDGKYDLSGEIIDVENGIARNVAGSLAGSTLTMDAAVRNAMEASGLDFETVLPMATSVPAEAMNLKGQKGTLQPGADADVILLDDELNVCMTMVAGHIVYEATEAEKIIGEV